MPARPKAPLPEGVAVTILADRGFGDVELFQFLESRGFQYVIRFRGNIHVSAADGETRLAADWVGKHGRGRKSRDAEFGRPLEGRRGRVREGSGHEGGLASGRQRRLAAAPQIIKLYSRLDHRTGREKGRRGEGGEEGGERKEREREGGRGGREGRERKGKGRRRGGGGERKGGGGSFRDSKDLRSAWASAR